MVAGFGNSFDFFEVENPLQSLSFGTGDLYNEMSLALNSCFDNPMFNNPMFDPTMMGGMNYNQMNWKFDPMTGQPINPNMGQVPNGVPIGTDMDNSAWYELQRSYGNGSKLNDDHIAFYSAMTQNASAHADSATAFKENTRTILDKITIDNGSETANYEISNVDVTDSTMPKYTITNLNDGSTKVMTQTEL